MDSYQLFWLIFSIPVMAAISIKEIIRGWRILKYNNLSLNLVLKARIKMIQIAKGDGASKEYHDRLLNNPKEMKLLAFYSILGGVIMLGVCVLWVFIVYRVFVN